MLNKAGDAWKTLWLNPWKSGTLTATKVYYVCAYYVCIYELVFLCSRVLGIQGYFLFSENSNDGGDGRVQRCSAMLAGFPNRDI